MNTPAHLIFGAGAFANPTKRGTFAASILGAFTPDLSLYLMTAVSIWGMGIPAERVFRELYYSEAWQQVFAIDNSFILWGLALALCLWRGWHMGVAFTGAALLHLAFDFPLHTHDARRHFWPVSDWVFESPVSYWDNAAYAWAVGPFALSASVILAWLVIRRYRTIPVAALIGLLLLMELGSSGLWRFVF